MKRLCQTIGISIILIRSLCSETIAQSYAELKEDIQRRAEVIEAYKRQGGLVEGPDGMLKPKADASAELSEAVARENEARRKVFAKIAERTGSAPDEVARFFAGRVQPVQQQTPNAPLTPRPGDTVAPEATPPGSFVPVAPGSSLPLKVLTRPESSLFAEPSDAAKVDDAGVPAFSTRVVAAMRDGWYQVTDAVGKPPSGWMRAVDVMEWRHHVVVSFTHPVNRSRNIFFKEKTSLTDLLKLPKDQRSSEWSQLLEKGTKGASPAVVGLEPEGWLREKNQFYVLPILDQDAGHDAGHEVMLLKVAAASRARPAPVRSKPKLDIVFVMDLTRSMGPFVKATLKMLRDVSGSIGGSSSDPDAVRFGLWGYRDDKEICQGIDFNTKNFTPELQDLPRFLKTVESVDETQIDSIDYAEDVLAGVHDAIEQTKWRSGAVRTILLVGDAPGRAPGESEPECRLSPKPEGTASGMDTRRIRARANDKSVYLSAFYLQSPKWKGFTERGLKQFRALSLNPGSTSPDCQLLNGVNSEDYKTAASLWAARLGENLKSFAAGREAAGAGQIGRRPGQDHAGGSRQEDGGQRLPQCVH
jgi:serine/threonine-protein kinase PpkA